MEVMATARRLSSMRRKSMPAYATRIEIYVPNTCYLETRKEWVSQKVGQFANYFGRPMCLMMRLYIPAHYFFERLKLFALFTKHPGFKEEREWRVAYLPDRDPNQRAHEHD